jgi:hypothetical protein
VNPYKLIDIKEKPIKKQMKNKKSREYKISVEAHTLMVVAVMLSHHLSCATNIKLLNRVRS